jgi:hypothetical protein
MEGSLIGHIDKSMATLDRKIDPFARVEVGFNAQCPVVGGHVLDFIAEGLPEGRFLVVG